jgi:glycosyltransferase involved in cell wall biosynthesis
MNSSPAKAFGFAHPAQPGLVSVVIPTYQRAETVVRAIESALTQSYPLLEVVVVDDGSSDRTREFVERIEGSVRYLYQANAGAAAARNYGMQNARGEYIAFLDSDDTWSPQKLEIQVAVLRALPQAVLTWTEMTAVDANGQYLWSNSLRQMLGLYGQLDLDLAMPRWTSIDTLVPAVVDSSGAAPVRVGDLSSLIIRGNLVGTSTCMFRRSALELAGPLDPRWTSGEDYEFFTRLCRTGLSVFIDAPLAQGRIGAEDQLTHPTRVLAIARNDLRTLKTRLSDPGFKIDLLPNVLNQRVAWSHEWVGMEAFEMHRRLETVHHLLASMLMRPRADRRLAVLACCLLPWSGVEFVRKTRKTMMRRLAGRVSAVPPDEDRQQPPMHRR